jgi:SAM-dependent methyltransferase
MRREFLANLHCPYSGSPLSLSKVTREEGEEIEYGVVTGEAGDFAIVEGILRLHVDEYREPIVEHVREKRLRNALTIAFDDAPCHGRAAAINFATRLAFRTGFSSAGERLSRMKGNFVRAVTDSDATFMEIAKKLSPDASADWQLFRFSMPTFLPVFALLHIVKGEGSILDFGCGIGQASFLISRMWPNSNVICADYSFSSLYLAKKFFIPDASYVCLDGNYLLPFESGQFSTIFSSDTLHFIDSKLSLVQEFTRVGGEKSVTILPHLHNRSASPYAKSFTPKGYRKLFEGMETRLVPEQEVIRSYFFEDVIDLGRNWSEKELAAAEQGLSMVASADSSLFKRTEGLWDQRIRSFRHPCINPAYRIAGAPGNWELTRRASDRYAKTLTHLDQSFLPNTCRVVACSVDTPALVELQRTDPSQFTRLVKSLVVVDLPERFMKQSQGLQRGKDLLPASQQAAL